MTSHVASPIQTLLSPGVPCQVWLMKPKAVCAIPLHKVLATSEKRRIAVTSINKGITTA